MGGKQTGNKIVSTTNGMLGGGKCWGQGEEGRVGVPVSQDGVAQGMDQKDGFEPTAEGGEGADR